jgi:hypothetical protein
MVGMGVTCFVACYIALSIDVATGAASIWPASGLLLGVPLLCSDRAIPSITRSCGREYERFSSAR